MNRSSIHVLREISAMAAVLPHPIIMRCDKHINLRVDLNVCEDFISCSPSCCPHQLYLEHATPESTSAKEQYKTVDDNDVPVCLF